MSNMGPLTKFRTLIGPSLIGPPALAFLPAVTLGAFWLGGETALVLASLGIPLLFAVAGAFSRQNMALTTLRDSVTGLVLRDGFDVSMEQIYQTSGSADLQSACFTVQLDDFTELSERYGQDSLDRVARQSGQRIQSALRDRDVVARLDDNRFAVCLNPVRQLDLETCITIAGRMQSTVEEPISLDGLPVYVSCSIGFCMRNRAPGSRPEDWFDASEMALATALQNGPSSIRAYTPGAAAPTHLRSDLLADAAKALNSGQIVPWFQPQISTDTGQVTGFEALARWIHPVHGTLPPDEFLKVFEEAGMMQSLTQTILFHSLTALKAWDAAKLEVPTISVNFDSEEMRDPKLLERIAWELDRFDLTPERLVVEVLETVMTNNPDDVVSNNIRGLRDLGCQIDLDDFGTGHASIASIRRFGFARIKIDRSFVMKADQDLEQQRLVGAILTMAERLELETLAEGVETVGEHALLAQLGCNHVQGFGIGRPMPFDKTLDWISAHRAKLVNPPMVGRDIG